MESGAEGACRSTARLDAENAGIVAATLHALATPSRLLILAQLRHGPLTVTVLAQTIGMRQPIVSQQLGILRAAGLVAGTRLGRAVSYRLAGEHVTELLDDVAYHSERVRAGATPA
ncbi:ArsR/SmtB family transcription factor [Amycolatopsis vastitatis]|uniref:Transcriptional regulator n=1 Tax=Amycolatopsis vastitatis TaxID=1905142 RepID=A0A229SM09_9PSEU|nr:metalloregulator ArsR/SmtB family transcription factor [Amycolatopsis vastitatis]OXM59691.1 transcriptional regulator [Amycolatopsis vastitatis]